ncbi:MAG: type III-B CRISPR-associated protein Cas10/Cmr2, partial [Candidatus Bathyarchaeia archaeon]
AGVDRWLLSILGGDKKGAFYYGKVKIKNCFDPRLSVELGEEPKNIDNFFSSLHEIIAKAKNSKVAWHLLYSLYELLWIEHSFASGPADTRIPTHNVFDHCYATVAVTNWYMRSTNPKGILVTIDIAGVQSFISEARKLRDFWAASYMV